MRRLYLAALAVVDARLIIQVLVELQPVGAEHWTLI